MEPSSILAHMGASLVQVREHLLLILTASSIGYATPSAHPSAPPHAPPLQFVGQQVMWILLLLLSTGL